MDKIPLSAVTAICIDPGVGTSPAWIDVVPGSLTTHHKTFAQWRTPDGHGYSVELKRICGFRFQPDAADDGGEELPEGLAGAMAGAGNGAQSHVLISPWPKEPT